MTLVIASSNQSPWEIIGKRVRQGISPLELLKEAGLDWTVDKVQYQYEYKGEIKKSSKYALVRSSDSCELTTTTDDWEPVQNAEAFNFFTDFVKAGDMEMDLTNSICNGRIVWALAKVKESFTLFGEDRVESNLLFTLPHEYGRSIDIRFTPIRPICGNSLVLALTRKGDLSVRINHRKKFDAEVAKKALGIAHHRLDAYRKNAEFLGARRARDEQLKEFFMRVFPSVSEEKKELKLSRPAKLALDQLETQPGAHFAKGSWWQAYNAATFTIDHLILKDPEKRLFSSWYGANRTKKIKALETAIEMAELSGAL